MNKLFFVTILIIFCLFLVPKLVRGIEFSNPLETESVEEILGRIAKFLRLVAFALVPIMAIIVGFMFLTAGGEPEKIKKARDFLLWMAIGVVVILISSGLVSLIKEILGVGDEEETIHNLFKIAKVIKNLLI